MLRSILFLVSILISVNSFAQSKFEQLGLSFTVPTGWEISDLEKGDASVYFSCEKKGGQGTEVAAFSIIAMDLELEDHLKNTKDEYQKTLADLGANVNWGKEIKSTTIGSGLETAQLGFTAEDETGMHNGMIYVFRACGNTVLLITSCSKKDAAANAPAFELINSSLSCQ